MQSDSADQTSRVEIEICLALDAVVDFHEGDLSAPGGIIVDTWLTCHNFLSHRVQTAVFCPL